MLIKCFSLWLKRKFFSSNLLIRKMFWIFEFYKMKGPTSQNSGTSKYFWLITILCSLLKWKFLTLKRRSNKGYFSAFRFYKFGGPNSQNAGPSEYHLSYNISQFSLKWKFLLLNRAQTTLKRKVSQFSILKKSWGGGTS